MNNEPYISPTGEELYEMQDDMSPEVRRELALINEGWLAAGCSPGDFRPVTPKDDARIKAMQMWQNIRLGEAESLLDEFSKNSTTVVAALHRAVELLREIHNPAKHGAVLKGLEQVLENQCVELDGLCDCVDCDDEYDDV